jgi:hypothetical protein
VHKISGSSLKPNTVTGKQVKESTLGTVPRAATARKLPSPKVHNLTLISGWGNAPDFNDDAAYTIDAQGYVHLEGAISSEGLTDDPFVLPKKARPRHDTYVPVPQSGGYTGYLFIPADGVVEIASDPAASPGNEKIYTGLDGVTFLH